jgi:hypothetical protein
LNLEVLRKEQMDKIELKGKMKKATKKERTTVKKTWMIKSLKVLLNQALPASGDNMLALM